MANFQSAVIAILSVTVVLGVMIFVHEWGHFIAAKLSGVKVEVFSFGFGTRLFGVKRGDPDYHLSALPFGGYVRMAGDNPIEERTGAAYEFLSKPRWVRVVIACAGPAMNIIFGFLIFWGIFWLVGAFPPKTTSASPRKSPRSGGKIARLRRAKRRSHRGRQGRRHTHLGIRLQPIKRRATELHL